MSEWYNLYSGGTGEIEEKKSRFIANIAVVNSQEEATAFIAKIKKQYWDARHNCSAFVLGDEGEVTRCSDDGEPSGTAGRPMLEVLTGERITNICVVVTRYFGGTLLGTGGLVRAYQGAVKEGLKSCSILRKIAGRKFTVSCDYNDYGKISFLCTQNGYNVMSTEYGEKVDVTIIVPEEEYQQLIDEFNEATSARVSFGEPLLIKYMMVDGSPLVCD